MSKITYADKVTLNENPDVADVNKVKASDMNEIKNVVNANDDKFNYTQEEQRIGTWIDGKPVYRKVIQTTSPSNDDTNTNIYTITENIENAIRLDGYIHAWNPNYRGNINCFINSSDYIATWFLTNSSGYPAYIRCRQHNRGNSPMRIIMEYTKTTD